jgi:nicotinamidase-related amidase
MSTMKAMTHALVVVDVQNEFSSMGQRPVPNHAAALAAIKQHVEEARRKRTPIAWVRHYNKPHESPAFVPASWGSEFSPGFGPATGFRQETVFEKQVYGAFTDTGLEEWLHSVGARSVLIVGFYAHMCLPTCVREALIRGFDVLVDPAATGAGALEHPGLGSQTADEVRRSALLQLTNMGAQLVAAETETSQAREGRAETKAAAH